jgi:Asp-tRNA(Asn)/Glu-tRNA(Gln) amidotransferase A subunit family amidase
MRSAVQRPASPPRCWLGRSREAIDEGDLHYLELTELARRLCQRELTSVEVTRLALERIGKLEPDLACYARVTPERALAAAKAADFSAGGQSAGS